MLCYYAGSGVTVTSGQTLPIFSLGGSTLNGLGFSLTKGGSSDIGFPSSNFGPAIPPKLKKKILDAEFVDMSELLPDGWRQQEDETGRCCRGKSSLKRGPVTDITLWAESYATLVGVLAEKYPTKVPGFMSHMKCVLKASRSYQGEAWVSYDMAYRRQAAYRKSLDWGIMDFSLFNETFAGRAKALARCKYCVSELHASQDCEFAPAREAQRPAKRPAVGLGDRNTTPLCLLFNSRLGNQCRYKQCRFAHLCSACHAPHPFSSCQSKLPRMAVTRTPMSS